MAQSMKKEIRKTFGFAREKFSDKVRLHTQMPGVPIILSKSVCVKPCNKKADDKLKKYISYQLVRLEMVQLEAKITSWTASDILAGL